MGDVFKVTFLGNELSGKTSICLRIVQNTFNDVYSPTIQDFYKINFTDNDCDYDSYKGILRIQEISGSDLYEYEYPNWMKFSNFFVICYSMIDRSSLSSVEMWYDTIQKYHPKGTFGLILVSTFLDMSNSRKTTYEEGRQLSFKYRCDYLEVSSKTGENINTLISYIMRSIPKVDIKQPTIKTKTDKSKRRSIFRNSLKIDRLKTLSVESILINKKKRYCRLVNTLLHVFKSLDDVEKNKTHYKISISGSVANIKKKSVRIVDCKGDTHTFKFKSSEQANEWYSLFNDVINLSKEQMKFHPLDLSEKFSEASLSEAESCCVKNIENYELYVANSASSFSILNDSTRNEDSDSNSDKNSKETIEYNEQMEIEDAYIKSSSSIEDDIIIPPTPPIHSYFTPKSEDYPFSMEIDDDDFCKSVDGKDTIESSKFSLYDPSYSRESDCTNSRHDSLEIKSIDIEFDNDIKLPDSPVILNLTSYTPSKTHKKDKSSSYINQPTLKLEDIQSKTNKISIPSPEKKLILVSPQKGSLDDNKDLSPKTPLKQNNSPLETPSPKRSSPDKDQPLFKPTFNNNKTKSTSTKGPEVVLLNYNPDSRRSLFVNKTTSIDSNLRYIHSTNSASSYYSNQTIEDFEDINDIVDNQIIINKYYLSEDLKEKEILNTYEYVDIMSSNYQYQIKSMKINSPNQCWWEYYDIHENLSKQNDIAESIHGYDFTKHIHTDRIFIRDGILDKFGESLHIFLFSDMILIGKTMMKKLVLKGLIMLDEKCTVSGVSERTCSFELRCHGITLRLKSRTPEERKEWIDDIEDAIDFTKALTNMIVV